MTNFKTKLAIGFSVLGLSVNLYAAPVLIKNGFSESFTGIDYDVRSKNPAKFYIKDTNKNVSALSKYGEVYTDLSSVKYDNSEKPRFKLSSNTTFSLNYFGAASDNLLGECVSFVKAVTNAKKTEKWYGEKKVNKNEKLKIFTPIATLTRTRPDGKPGYDSSGYKSHVGLYLSHYKDGILMLDQNFYEDGKMNVHYLPFSGNNQGNAENYYILEQDWFKICNSKKQM